VSLVDDHADVSLYRGGKSTPVAAFGTQAENADAHCEVLPEIEELGPSLAASIVRIPGKYALQRTLTLPSDAEENLENVLGFEMDRLTPFSRDEVYFDFSVTSRDRSKRTIDLDFTVARKETVDSMVDSLAARGVRPTVLTVSDKPFVPQPKRETECVNNLLPHERRALPSRQTRFVPLILAVTAALLAATAMALPFVQRDRMLQALDSVVDDVRSAAIAAEETRDEIESVTRHGLFLASKRAELPSVVQMLDEITRVLPDDTVLMRFEVSGTRLRIQGESASASSLISLIEGANFFHRASFASPVTKNPRTNKDRFTLEAELIAFGGDT
jgi:general secretion pathway protein L